MKVLDLFSGCGGLSYGFSQAGFKITAGLDSWDVALKTFKENHDGSEIIQSELTKGKSLELGEQFRNKIDVIIGGPPCQGFSVAGKRIIEDERNNLYLSFIRLVNFLKPEAFLMENVPHLTRMGKGMVFKRILEEFSTTGYNLSHSILLASDYGVPQNRKRVFLVGFKDKVDYQFPPPIIFNDKVSAKDAISDLPEYSLEDGSSYEGSPESEYQSLMRKNSKGIYNHQITEHQEQTKKIISLVPDGGNYKDLPSEFRNTRRVNIAWTRLNSSRPSFTIDTGHRHHFHYKYNRIPTVRESARIQSFDDSFVFSGNKTQQYIQVGNAVPPLLAKALGKSLLEKIGG